VHRVVVTGWGVVSPIGNNAADYWRAIAAGISGLGPPTLAPIEQLSQKVVAEVKDFAPQAHFSNRQLAIMDRVAQFGVVAAREAIARSGLAFPDGLGERTATIIGTASGGRPRRTKTTASSTRKGRGACHRLQSPG
jgi:nodulation protein E